MRLARKFNQHRYDFHWDYECEFCGHTGTNTSGYDDNNYYQQVIPNMKCPHCNKSHNDAIELLGDLANKPSVESLLLNKLYDLLQNFPKQTPLAKLDFTEDIKYTANKLYDEIQTKYHL